MRIVSSHPGHAPHIRDVIPAPYLGALSLYGGSFLKGALSLEATLAALDTDGAQITQATVTREGFAPGFDLAGWLTHMSGAPQVRLNLLLPEPGNLAGLPGPPSVFRSALHTGQALVVCQGHMATSTLCADPPRHAGARWLPLFHEEAPRPVPVEIVAAHASATREDLFRFLDHALTDLRELDLVPDEPVRPATLSPGWILLEPPAGMHPTHAHTARIAGRLCTLAEESLGASELAPEHIRILKELRAKARRTIQASLSYASTER